VAAGGYLTPPGLAVLLSKGTAKHNKELQLIGRKIKLS
jgi:hypothetical protein